MTALKSRRLASRCKPARWPFPKLVRVGMADYLTLVSGVEANVPAPSYELEKLIEAATAATTTKTTK